MVRVRLENIVKQFGKVTAVNNVSFETKEGEFIVLLGPSGCGKTTLLRCISGLEKVTSGRIFFNEREVTHLPPKERNISMVFQNYAVWPHLKVYDNIAFPLKIKKVSPTKIEEKVKWAADILGITELLQRFPHELSGGQRQRVAVARAIVMEPDVLLMDEPLSNLDALLRVKMRSEIKKLQENIGVTTIYVTHDQVEAMTMGDRIAVFKSGRLLQLGTSDEIYHKPKTLFVAGFIGSPQMNFIEVEITERDGNLFAENKDFSIPIAEEHRSQILKDHDYIFGIRPEHIYIKPEENIPTKKFSGTLYFVEALRSDTVLHIETSFGKIVAKIPGDIILKEGEKVDFYMDLEKVHLFDKETEEAIF